MRSRKWHGYCVYMLRDPRTMRVHYVGMSGNVRARFACHKNPAKYESLHEWVNELKQLGMLPILDVRFSGLTKQQALRCESILVEKMRNDFSLIQGYVSKKHNPAKQLAIAIEAIRNLDARGIEEVYGEICAMRVSRKARAAS